MVERLRPSFADEPARKPAGLTDRPELSSDSELEPDGETNLRATYLYGL